MELSDLAPYCRILDILSLLMMASTLACLIIANGLHRDLPTIFWRQPKPLPALLRLPAELRNAIYREALVSSGSLRVTKGVKFVPSLLHTCQQIRKESASIYWMENQFAFNLVNLDFSDFLAFKQHVRSLGRYEPKIVVDLSGFQPSWSALLKGLEACHKGYFGFHDISPKSFKQPLQASWRAVQMVQEMRPVPWETVMEVLEVYKKATSKDDTSWNWDD